LQPQVDDAAAPPACFRAVSGGTALALQRPMKTIDLDSLAAVTGGMKWEDFPESTNVEDRRGLSPRESMRVKSPPAPPLPPLVRTPNDLSHQAGLDDIQVPRRRR
jgi:hypothetical protein